MILRPTGLWLHSEFRKLWGGQASSLFASQAMYLGLPLVAVISLDATPIQMGIVTALSGVPAIFGLYIGSWAERRRKRPILVAADIGRAGLLITIPVAHVFDALTIEVLYVVSLGFATLTMVFQIGYRALLPLVVERAEITEANSKLEFANSSSSVAGPAGVGLLAQAVTAPFALIAGSLLYLVSSAFFLAIRTEAPDPRYGPRVTGGVMEGIRYFWHRKPLVGIVASSFVFAVFGTAINAMAGLYMIRELGINEATLGVMITVGGAGLFIGAFLASRYTNVIGIGRATTIGFLAAAIGDFGIPLVTGSLWFVVPVIVAGYIITQVGLVLYNIGAVSIRQSIAPENLQARLTSISVVVFAAGMPIGGLLGGFLGETIGLRATLFLSASVLTVATAFLVVFRTWSVRLEQAE